MSVPIIIHEQRKLFIEYCRIWHGEHDKKWARNNGSCRVFKALSEYDMDESKFDLVVEAFDDVDGAWDSWEQFYNMKNTNNN